ncbi:P-loop containing nucleoside triphosphate hydrolase protein [Gyrodon lividus]|nr:P-loop containing nucleoside triphosphate hydrolase protein [Gyrodon lividus]
MDFRTRWVSGNKDTRRYYDVQRYQEINEERLHSSPEHDSVNYNREHEYATAWNDINSSPSPPERQGMNYAPGVHPPTPFAGRYNAGHRQGGVRPSDLPFGSFSRALQGGDFQRDASPFDQTHARNNTLHRGRPPPAQINKFPAAILFQQGIIYAARLGRTYALSPNCVISAPTGSGKTVLFELGIIRMLTEAVHDSKSAKCVYVAPTKALCTEKHKEWTAKFGGLGVKSCELTGDTLALGKGVWGDAKSSQIIVTTAEKWDSLTRNWTDHSGILSQIKLFLVDEVHILNESRGSTLEVVISRMKARGPAIRFLLVSATVPNIEDVACWIGSNDDGGRPAKTFQFGEEFRPCKLTKFVYGVTKPRGQNDFAYAHTLDLRLFTLLRQHSADKPILIFCPTRKGTVATAKQLAKDYEKASKAKQALPWSLSTRVNGTFHDKELAALVTIGIAVHHAGLDADDRKAVEELYLQKTLRVLVATSTLAVGVNLPAHMVVIKGVKIYQNGEMREYSDLDVMQMMGRAGRPQFDDEGVAIILCETDLEHKYRALAQGTTTLESSLHQHLAEHLNSEISLGTISNVETAKDWLRCSFLFRRIQKNPRHYDIGKDDNQTWQEKIDEIVMQSILSLRETQLIAYTEMDGELCSTEYGDVMSKFYIRQSTMYEKIRRHNDIRFPPTRVTTTSDKTLLLIQAILAGLPLNSPEFRSSEGQPYLEAVSIFRHAIRIVTAVAEVAIVNRSGAQLKHSLELQVFYKIVTRLHVLTINYRIRCLNAKAWEDRPLVLRQIEHIGEKSVKVLAENGINSIQKLLQTSPLRVEESSAKPDDPQLLNRRPPFGFDVLATANEFPRYFLNLKEIRSTHSNGNSHVEVEFSVECGLIFESSAPQRAKKPKWGRTEMTTLLIITSDLVFVDFRRTATKALKDKKKFTIIAQLTKPSQAISVYIASLTRVQEKFAGVMVSQTLKPHIASDKYPTLDTRPLTSVVRSFLHVVDYRDAYVTKEMDMEGLEDVPDFWDMSLDDEEEIQDPPVMDLTKPRGKDMNAPQTGAKTQPKLRSSSPVRQSKQEQDPRKRPDGKYHCQEGLLEPPRASKKRQPMNTEDSVGKIVAPQQSATTARSKADDVQKRQTQTNQVVTVNRPKSHKRYPSLQQLESLHQNAYTAHNIRPIERQRSKLTDSPKNARPSTAVPNFDLQLMTLRRSRSPAPKTAPANDDCDLPLISEILEQDKTTSETNYSNSEIDAMIRDMPSDSLAPIQLSSTPKPSKRSWSQCDESTPNNEGSPLYSVTTPQNVKGTSEMESKRPLSKRARTSSVTGLFGSLSHLLGKQATSHSVSVKSSEKPLFSHSSDDDDVAADLRERAQENRSHFATGDQIPAYDDDFHLDETCFDVAPDSASETLVHQSSANEWNTTLPSSNEWSRDDASTHRTLFSRGRDPVKETAPQPGDAVELRVPPFVMRRKNSYLLSPSRISGFIRRSKPHVQDPSKIDNHTLHRNGSALPHIDARINLVAGPRAGVSSQTHGPRIDGAPTNDPDETLDDPLADFDRWLASGAVEITPE